jgi:hypothetical protein
MGPTPVSIGRPPGGRSAGPRRCRACHGPSCPMRYGRAYAGLPFRLFPAIASTVPGKVSAPSS